MLWRYFFLWGQHTDTLLGETGLSGNTVHFIRKNIPKNKFWGNSWYSSIAYNLSRSNEFSLHFGRTYGRTTVSGGGGNIHTRSWGVGYSYFKKRSAISAFWEISNFYFPPATGRLDYIYDLDSEGHFLRPAIGLNLGHIDILYNYSIKLYGEENPFRHGVIFRIKYWFNHKNWQENAINVVPP